ncbi:MAG TPA: sodium:solute symporter [Pyrinomonadaceae bacterium]|jgi:SSS family transporter|nr:sodium:solute symporter [Pyrinomonadaceae bacterium]
MKLLDWLVLVGFILFIVVYGVWKGRRNSDLDGYLLADRRMRWYTVALSIMATQASAITFLSTPGQAYADGMRFVQFYLGLPVAMVILSITAVPVYHRLKVYTAYEYLEVRFDLKTRALAGGLFLIQRGLSAGLTIYAPSLIFSLILGLDIRFVILFLGGLVTLYTASGGTKAVEHTHFQQALITTGGMVVAFFTVLALLPKDVSFVEAVSVAGKMGRLNAIDFSFDPQNQYNFWSGLIGGCFLALSYFGTDQSQVQRYLTGRSVAESRVGLLFNGMAKVPMQFAILFLGAMVFVFYLFAPSPLFFNPGEARKIKASASAAQFAALEARHAEATTAKGEEVRGLVEALRTGDAGLVANAENDLQAAEGRVRVIRAEAVTLMKANDARANTNDTNYIFLTFVTSYMPTGIVGLVIAAIFLASMSSSASELNALASTTVVDIYRRLIKREASERHYLIFSKLATLMWGAFAILFAQYAGSLGSLVEAVNRLGSLFYGTILGIFLLAFYFKRVGGTATFVAALVGEATVLLCARYTSIAFLWFNVIGCLVVIVAALVISPLLGNKRPAQSNPDASES